MKIIMTGGGTAGHVIPNLTLMPRLLALGFEIFYVGSREGIERGMVEYKAVPYFAISSGKLRRYFSFRNFTDVFRILKGVWDSIKIIRRIKPDIVFSKGGFVVVPLVFAAWLLDVRVIIHESDLTPGLANRLAMPFAKKVLVSFPETLLQVPKRKSVFTGVPLREDLLAARKEDGLDFLGFLPSGKPILLVTGGSLGSKALNACVLDLLPKLLESFRVVLLSGRGNVSGVSMEGFKEYAVLNKDLPGVLAAADIVVSRAGANTLFELLALGKPNLLVPLTLGQSRGDQIINAGSFERRGFSAVLQEEFLRERFLDEVVKLYSAREAYAAKMADACPGDAADAIAKIIFDEVRTLL